MIWPKIRAELPITEAIISNITSLKKVDPIRNKTAMANNNIGIELPCIFLYLKKEKVAIDKQVIIKPFSTNWLLTYLEKTEPEFRINMGRIRQCTAHKDEKKMPNLSANDFFCMGNDVKIKLNFNLKGITLQQCLHKTKKHN
jgi:hypothetical protein